MIKRKINEELTSMMIQTPLHPSSSTINAILQLESSSSITSSNQHQSSFSLHSSINIDSNLDKGQQGYRDEASGRLLNRPSTQIESEIHRLSCEHARIMTRRLTTLRTDLYLIRLQFERNRFQLTKMKHIIANQQEFINKLEMLDVDQM